MHIAVIGSGVAGLSAAALLQQKHKVTLIEADARIGGHTHTVELARGPDRGLPVDTGFIVLNRRTYPLCLKFFALLGAELQDSDMSFGVWDPQRNFYYCSDVPHGLFAQRCRLLNPKYWAFWREVLRFNAEARTALQSGLDPALTLSGFLKQKGYSEALKRDYLLPMGAAIWSASLQSIAQFPAIHFFRFFNNHGLLTVKEHPQWLTVRGGSHSYLKGFRSFFKGELISRAPVERIEREAGRVRVSIQSGAVREFDKVVIATHADQALRMLVDPTAQEQSVLGSWHYSRNRTLLHTDRSVMPPSRRAWASWNYRSQPGEQHPVAVTYYMNRLQQLKTKVDYFVSLNSNMPIAPEHRIKEIVYEHPQYTVQALDSQERLAALQGEGGLYFCGSYFGYGFHEDAVRSGVKVAAQFGCEL